MASEAQIKNAIASERKDNRKRETLRAMIVVFVGIPGAVVLAVGVWLALQRGGVI